MPEIMAINAVFVLVTICKIMLQIELPIRNREFINSMMEKFVQRFVYGCIEPI